VADSLWLYFNAVGYYNGFLWELALEAGQLDRAEQYTRQVGAAYQAGGAVRAATLLGAAGSLRESLVETPAPFITDDLDRCRGRAAEALGPVRYGEHERHGRSMTSHEAINYGLRAVQGQGDLVAAEES